MSGPEDYCEYVRYRLQAALAIQDTVRPIRVDRLMADLIRGHRWPTVSRQALSYAIPHFEQPDKRWWEDGHYGTLSQQSFSDALMKHGRVMEFVREFMSRMYGDDQDEAYERLVARLLAHGNMFGYFHMRLSYQRLVNFAERVNPNHDANGAALAAALQQNGDWARALEMLHSVCGLEKLNEFCDIVLPVDLAHRAVADRLREASLYELSVICDAAVAERGAKRIEKSKLS